MFSFEMLLPDDDGLLAACHKAESEFWMTTEFYIAWLWRFLSTPTASAWILVRRRLVQVTENK